MFEHKFPFKSTNSGGSITSSGGNQIKRVPSLYEPEHVHELRRSKRAKVSKNFRPNFVFSLEDDPTCLQEALTSPDASFWQEAIDNEMDSLLSNKTWDLVELPPGCKIIGFKWILKKKMKLDGTVEKFKARLVAKGYKQRENVDFFDTYSPVSRIAIRVLMVVAAIHNLEVHQMDVKTAFLNGDLDEEIYLDQPEGIVVAGQEHKVCKLNKSIYGLRQSSKKWHDKFDGLVISNGYRINESDKCIYYRYVNNVCTIICLYVNDLLILGSNLDVVNETNKRFRSECYTWHYNYLDY